MEYKVISAKKYNLYKTINLIKSISLPMDLGWENEWYNWDVKNGYEIKQLVLQAKAELEEHKFVDCYIRVWTQHHDFMDISINVINEFIDYYINAKYPISHKSTYVLLYRSIESQEALIITKLLCMKTVLPEITSYHFILTKLQDDTYFLLYIEVNNIFITSLTHQNYIKYDDFKFAIYNRFGIEVPNNSDLTFEYINGMLTVSIQK